MQPNRPSTVDPSSGRGHAPRATTTSESTRSVKSPQMLQPSGVCTPGAASARFPVEKNVPGALTMCSRFGCSATGAVELLIPVNVHIGTRYAYCSMCYVPTMGTGVDAAVTVRRDAATVSDRVRPSGTVWLWAALGLALVGLATTCWTRWLLSPQATPVDPGPDPYSFGWV